MRRSIHYFVTIVVLLVAAPAMRGEDLNVPPRTIEGGTPSLMMHRYISWHV